MPGVLFSSSTWRLYVCHRTSRLLEVSARIRAVLKPATIVTLSIYLAENREPKTKTYALF